jgi:hypothetical protein
MAQIMEPDVAEPDGIRALAEPVRHRQEEHQRGKPRPTLNRVGGASSGRPARNPRPTRRPHSIF